MSRIRSLHPTQWTDEKFVECSPLARLLAIALRNEADDRGVFEWKPLTIKMRLLPADNCDVADLLGELRSSEQVSRFEYEGKSYGLIRNFMQFQRPKKPVYRFPVPPEFPTGTEPVPQKAEIDPQMEDEGEGEEDRICDPATLSPPAQVIKSFDRIIVSVFGVDKGRQWPHSTDHVFAKRMLDSGADLPLIEGVILALCLRFKAEAQGPPRSIKTLETWVAAALTERNRPAAEARNEPPHTGTARLRKPSAEDRMSALFGSDSDRGGITIDQ